MTKKSSFGQPASRFTLHSGEYLTGVSVPFRPFTAVNTDYLEDNYFAGVEVLIYGDDDGLPAGLPGGSGEPLLEISATELNEEFRVISSEAGNFELYIDLEALSGEKFILEEGTYWLVVNPVLGLDDVSLSSVPTWYRTDAPDGASVVYHPGDPFDAGSGIGEGWVPVSEFAPEVEGLAKRIFTGGTVPGSDEIDPAPAAALSGEVDQNSGEVTLDWLSPEGEGFMEAFSGTLRGWEFEEGEWGLMDGYLLWPNDSGAESSIAVYEDAFDDFFFEAEMKFDGGGDDDIGLGGLFFRSDGQFSSGGNIVENGYVVALGSIEGTLYFVTIAVEDDEFEIIDHYRSSSQLNADPSGSNVISVNANGSLFDIYLNGGYEFSFSDSRYESGKAGIHASLDLSVSFDYAAVLASTLPAYRSPNMVSSAAENPVTNQGQNLLDYVAQISADEDLASQEQSGSKVESAGMLKPLLNSGLASPGSVEFVEYEVWRNGSLVGTTSGTSFTDQLTEPGIYEYEVKAVFSYAEAAFSNSLEINFGPTSTPDDPNELPAELALSQNYPNPFNPVTQIQYDLPEAGEVRIEVFNVNGQRVALLANGQQAAGRHQVSFDGSALSSGVYLYRLQTASGVITRKMMLVK